MTIVAVIIFAILLAMLAGPVLYLLLLVIAAAFRRERRAIQEFGRTPHRYLILIPAHDEAQILPATLEWVKKLRINHPDAQPPTVVVVADNCTDSTAQIAFQAGVKVYERHNLDKRGKGHALEWAFERIPVDFPAYEAVVIFDADTMPDLDFLNAAERTLQSGAQVIQGRYDVLKPGQTWRTALMYVAFVLYNHIRPLGRLALGLSDGLRGNGMVFRREILERFPWQAFSLVEDIEYGNRLASAEVKVTYAPGAKIYGQAAANGAQATSQRLRWEGGRLAQARQDVPSLMKLAFKRRSFIPFDRAADLIIPPLGLLMALTMVLAVLNLAIWWWLGDPALGWLSLGWLALIAGEVSFVLGGLLVARAPGRAYLALVFAPIFIAWKMRIYAILLLRRIPSEWVRTERTKIEAADAPIQAASTAKLK